MVAGGVYVVAGAFETEERAIVWFIAAFAISLIISYGAVTGQELLRRLADSMARRDDRVMVRGFAWKLATARS